MIVARNIPTSSFKRQVTNDYYHWLRDQLEMDTPDYSYFFLAQLLYAKKFYTIIPNDENRAIDGMALRQRFSEEAGYNTYDVLDGPCSVLEMLFALAERIDAIMADIGNENRTTKWFWELLENLGLDMFRDDVFYDLNGTVAIDKILNIFLGRTYKRNGRGGLFPLIDPDKDQRKVEIWYQMNQYLIENYYSEDEEKM